ncbi:hypothetical protein G9A89_016274 [Geosiphon pyriformis]|nr:hypothetical protein G9A89_016274 [Geosiphon pyriformis]
MEPIGSSAGGFGSVSAGLGTCQSAKKKHVDMVYSWSASYKKPKKPAAGNVVNSSTRLLSLEDIGGAGAKPVVSWGSEVGSVTSSVSGLSDVENMVTTMAEETSYAESGEDNGMDENTPRKTRIQTYMLGNLLNDDEKALELPPSKFNGANQMPHIRSRAPEKRNFEPVKFFALDIEVSAVPEKTNIDKLMAVKKIFYRIDGFGRASTLSKFPGIIRLSFTSEKSLVKTREMAINEKILVNDDLRKVNSHSDWEVIVKEIPVDLPKLAVDSAFFKFSKIVLIKMQLTGFWQKTLIEFELFEVASLVVSKWSVLMGKDSVHVALAVSDKQILLESYGGKTCFIGHNPNSYVHDRCVIICFGDEAFKLAAIGTVPVFKGAGLFLASCTRCKQFGHVMINCSLGENSGVRGKRMVSDQDWICLARIYKKKSALIAYPVLFGGKIWVQVAGGFPSCVVLSGLVGAGLHSGLVSPSMMTDSPTISHLNNRLAILEHSLELLTDRIFGILIMTSDVNSDMIVDTALVSSSTPLSIVHNAVVELSSSSSKVLTAKVGGLEIKLIALKALVGSVLDKLNILCFGSGLSVPLGMNNCVKQADIIHWHKDMNNLVSIVTETKLRGMVHSWITNKFDGVCVFTSGLDSGHMGSGVAIIIDSFLAKHVCKILEIPGQLLSIRLLFGNKLSVFILGLYAGASSVIQFSQASNINSLIARAVNKTSFVILGGDFNEDRSHKCASFRKCFDLGLCNSHGIAKMIDYVLVSSSLVNAIMDCGVVGVENFFDTDHRAVSVSVDLGGLLDLEFKNTTAANASMLSDAFVVAMKFLDKDAIWDIQEKMLVKASCLVCGGNFASLLNTWDRLDSVGASPVKSLFFLGSGFDAICSKLAKTRKVYCSSKMMESKRTKESHIRQTIKRRMESFEVDKGHTIRSVLKHLFHKVVLDHLVADEELVLEPDLVKSKINEIMEGWTRKYAPLDYVFDDAFSEVMCLIGFDELLTVVSNLPDGKTAGLSGVFNELTGQVKPQARLTSFLAAGAFVNDTIWVGSSQAAMQHIFNVASEFFRINDISINNDKTVVILINSQIANPSLTISGSPISIAKKGEPHQYLSIFLSSESLSTSSLAKAHSDVWFFVNLVLRKTVLDKQFAYLASAILLSIISYRTQFSFIPVSVCNKWDSMVRRCLKSKSRLPLNFPNNAVYHPSLYNFKTFEQIQAESKSAAVLAFANSVGILGPHVYVSPSNNFLSGVVCIFFGCDLSLGTSLASTFRLRGGTPMSLVLGEPRFLKCVPSLKCYGIAFMEQFCDKHGVAFSWKTFKHWKKLDPYGLVPVWFDISVQFFGSIVPSFVYSFSVSDHASPNICLSHNFGIVCDNLLDIDAAVHLSVYTNRSLSSLGTVGMKTGAAVFFENIDLGLGVKVSGLVSSMLMELQAIALALECVSSLCSVDLFSDSQAALDACRSESLLAQPDFRNCCWIERCHIANVICDKNLDVNWIKVKGHSSVPGNKHADLLAGITASSSWWLPHRVDKWFLRAGTLRDWVQFPSFGG